MLLEQFGIKSVADKGALVSVSPIDGKPIAAVMMDDAKAVESKIALADHAFGHWRDVPAPRRGELVRIFGAILREYKEPLAQLVTLECGKIIEEGRGEVQEMIDVCDFAVGLSRQLYGLTIVSERPGHVMQENWLPLGAVGVISAFNFPVAVWAWNAALAFVCGDPVVWKPSEKTPLTALACQHLFEKACMQFGDVPKGLSSVIIGERDVGEKLTNDIRLKLISATGSTRMGREVAQLVQGRFGKILLELGGNNAVIVTESADLNVAIPSIVFGAVGTCGQRCTSTRRLFVHESLYDGVLTRLKDAYGQIIASRIGNPLDKETLVGPLIDEAAKKAMQAALVAAKAQGGKVHFGEMVQGNDGGAYVQPAIVEMDAQTEVMCHETFAPILYVMKYRDLAEVMTLHNAVPQGLSSAIFTTDIRQAEFFKQRSDCGIANVNIGTSGAEIGGAFGGEKETGGGRESGSDAWKNYMRRQTSTTYYGSDVPALAQGIRFD